MNVRKVATPCTPTVTFYHGASAPDFEGWKADRGRSDEADMLFLSRSPNVARRYGRVFKIDYPVTGIPAISVEDWFSGQCPATSFLILGDGGYDFPVDTLVLREDPETEFHAVADIEALDDGLAFIHDPLSPEDRQFDAYITEHYDGDVHAFTADIQHSVST
ncbi:hypothetical protein [Marinobacter salsuginis]|uniref:Uncharacterized protein n=1 Tax=Marinobacter salsuginis TaxID=418719 RepID=A0A5M3Q252_9GAMM|nr:hypothetical protein [Marinobacter salsuginis]GBO89202.1 hypothetical protein MSSD14B_28700 [Marinobacter salsuginis]